MANIKALKILIVDDDETICQYLGEILKRMGGNDIEAVVSGKTALDLVTSETSRPDIILLDLSMPEMSGPEVMAELAAMQYGGSVILASARDTETLEYAKGLAVSRNVNVIGYIQKPFSRKKMESAFSEFGLIEAI